MVERTSSAPPPPPSRNTKENEKCEHHRHMDTTNVSGSLMMISRTSKDEMHIFDWLAAAWVFVPRNTVLQYCSIPLPNTAVRRKGQNGGHDCSTFRLPVFRLLQLRLWHSTQSQIYELLALLAHTAMILVDDDNLKTRSQEKSFLPP